jgi:hypothetical protein
VPATEELASGFLEGEGDLELRVTGREIDRLHRKIPDVEGVAALTDEEDGDALLIDAGHLLHREADLEERRTTRVADGVRRSTRRASGYCWFSSAPFTLRLFAAR